MRYALGRFHLNHNRIIVGTVPQSIKTDFA